MPSLPRPDDLRGMVLAKARGEPCDQAALEARLRSAVAEIVERQVACGLDIVNDGELSKPNFTDYVSERIAGCEHLIRDAALLLRAVPSAERSSRRL